MPQPTPVRADRAWTSFTAFTAELATMPDVVARLAEAHVPDGAGLCRACGRPGRGTPHLPWPCGPARLAQAAVMHPAPGPTGRAEDDGAPEPGPGQAPPTTPKAAPVRGARPARRVVRPVVRGA
ncbi:MAG TPA: hypothetical protein VD813_09110 [Pseudonocardia sp.]|nr:hypothetical protein [Pseudonocardia sp.]